MITEHIEGEHGQHPGYYVTYDPDTEYVASCGGCGNPFAENQDIDNARGLCEECLDGWFTNACQK